MSHLAWNDLGYALGGTLSDRLNPSHPCFDKKLKGAWKSFSKKAHGHEDLT